MELTQKELKFLTIMDETRLSGNKLFKSDSEQFKKLFSFTDKELSVAVRKLVRMELLDEIDVGANEIVYFHSSKVSKNILDAKLMPFGH
jgi:hypothetical protein